MRHMAEVIGYVWCADVHCPGCTRAALRHPSSPQLKLPYVITDVSRDENGIPDNPAPIDREGNSISPIFASDENAESEHCGDCGNPLVE